MSLTTGFIHLVNVLVKPVILFWVFRGSFSSELLLINPSRNILYELLDFENFYLFRKVNLLEREKQKMMIKQIKSIRSM